MNMGAGETIHTDLNSLQEYYVNEAWLVATDTYHYTMEEIIEGAIPSEAPKGFRRGLVLKRKKDATKHEIRLWEQRQETKYRDNLKRNLPAFEEFTGHTSSDGFEMIDVGTGNINQLYIMYGRPFDYLTATYSGGGTAKLCVVQGLTAPIINVVIFPNSGATLQIRGSDVVPTGTDRNGLVQTSSALITSVIVSGGIGVKRYPT